MIRLSEEDVRRFVEVARDSGLKIDEEARAAIEGGRPPEFYLGYLSGVVSVVMICRKFLDAFGAELSRHPRDRARMVSAESLAVEAIELITIRAAERAAVAAELYFTTRGEGR